MKSLHIEGRRWFHRRAGMAIQWPNTPLGGDRAMIQTLDVRLSGDAGGTETVEGFAVGGLSRSMGEVWPDATDEDLTAPGLRERLDARLPGLLTEFRAAMEELGFVW